MPTSPTKKGTGLKPLTHDQSKDFHQYVVFGATPADQLPTGDLFVGHPIKIKDQRDLNFCPLFAGAAVVEDEIGVELDPLSGYAWACKLIGSIQPNGMSLRDACEEIIKIGLIEQQFAPRTLDEVDDATFLADWTHYPEDLLPLAWEHARLSYFRADTGPHDIAGNMRAALAQNVAERRSILTGVGWRASWTNAPGGMIPTDYDPSEPADGHAIKIFGQMLCADGLRLVAQNSWGDEVGDKGLFYFPLSVVNAEFTFGAYTFKNLSPSKAAFYSQHGLCLDATTWVKIIAVAQSIIKSYI